MTMPSRGISPIQKKATGDTMNKLKNFSAKKTKVSVKTPKPTDTMSVGAANAPMPAFKKGGAVKGCKKGGAIDGVAKKGLTRGRVI